MMVIRAINTCFAVLCLFLCVPAVFAAEDARQHPVNPREQPLAVARADSAALIRDVLRTRQARAFGLDSGDFSGALPGTGARARSLRNLIDALADAGAETLWYCLLQDGASIANVAGSFGWDEPASPGDASPSRLRERLARIGLDTGNSAVSETTAAAGTTRIRVSRDSETEHAIGSGAPDPSDAAQAHLAAFLARRDGRVGVLAVSRPLFGLLSLVTDVDCRALLARFRLDIPATARVELFNNGGDLGFEARLRGRPPARPPKPAAPEPQTLLSFRKEPLLEVNIPLPARFGPHIPVDPGLLAFVNMDMAVMLPEAVNFTVWRREDGERAWAAVCLLPDREAFRGQLRRAYLIAEGVAAGGAHDLEVEEAAAPDGTALRVLRTGGTAFACGLAEGEGGSGYFIVSGSAADWPDPKTIRRTAAEQDSVARYRSVLDDAGRARLAGALAALARRHGLDIGERVFADALPVKDSGYAAVDGDSLVLLSRNGLLPFLAAAFAGRSL